ncbi:MAG TPA: alpha/beta fold hydrolase [Anaerohalosphaeraceae bacterium]|nr:alpha/beta fold hydrolase [Anaerohalosphaeraceae bacterium]
MIRLICSVFIFSLFTMMTYAQPTMLQTSAEQFIDHLSTGDYAAAAKMFDPKMAQAMPVPVLKQTWEVLISQCGAFQKRLGFRTEKYQQYDIAYVTCQFEKMALDAKIVFDPAGRISGLFFVPAQPAGSPKQTADAGLLPNYIKPDAFTEKEITIGKDPWVLPGTLTIPKGNGPFAAIVLVHGSGPNDRDETLGPNKPFKDLAQGMASKGVAVLRYEKRTLYYQARFVNDCNDLTVRQETVDDAIAAVEFLAEAPGIDKGRIIVLGHSLGGMLIPRIAAENKAIAGFVIMAGTTRPMEDSILEQIKYIAMLDGKINPEERKSLAEIQRQVQMVKSPSLKKETPHDQLPFNSPAGYWLDLRGYQPAAQARTITQPLLILQGQRDYQVTLADFEGWKKELGDQPNVELKLYPDLNHLFITGKEKCRPDEYLIPGHVAEEVINDIVAWVHKVK